jgi:uncharacterized protein
MDDIDAILALDTWAVVGCSPDPSRDSHQIAALLIREGKDVIPVHPSGGEILGRPVHASLHEIDRPVDVVDIFRRSEDAGAHVDEAIALGAKAVWLQLGVIDHEAAARARAAGLLVAMDKCPAIEIPRRRARHLA